MFNYVKVPNVNCPRCEKVIPANSGWQSKDCEIENMCDTVDFFTCKNFYTNCPHCGKWAEFERDNSILKVEDFGFKPKEKLEEWEK